MFIERHPPARMIVCRLLRLESPSRSSTLLDVKAALEAAAIEFIGSPADRPGLRAAKGFRTENAPPAP